MTLKEFALFWALTSLAGLLEGQWSPTYSKEIPRMQGQRSILGEFSQKDSEIQVQFNQSRFVRRQVLKPGCPRMTSIMVLVQIVWF